MRIPRHHFTGWRDYQRRLQRNARRKQLLRKLPYLAIYSGGSFLVLALVLWIGSWVAGHLSEAGPRFSDRKERPNTAPKKLSKQDFAIFFGRLDLQSAQLADSLALERGGVRYNITSSLDQGLQDYTLDLLQRSKTLQAAVVVLRPKDGRVLTMASYTKDGNRENLCLKANFPAASLFKIVAAAAALESAGFTPDQTMFFQGRRYTLYKQQLKQTVNRYTNKTTFKEAFALSINPVFGKLGIYELGRTLMSEYADRFLFNQAIPFDLPVEMSTIQVPHDDYGLAEIASGFNKRTLISPLHAALLASVVANNGIMVAPWLVEQVSNESGDLLYHRQVTQLTSPISQETAKDLKTLMETTVRYGTCRKSFHRLRRKKAFKRIDFGAKTGTINDRGDRYKYDWLTGYAIPEDTSKTISIAVLGVHGEKLGLRSSELSRYILQYYLKS